MYKYKKPTTTTIKINQSYVGERIEEKVFRIVNNKEPIEDTAPRIYTERKDGVLPAYDIRTDRFDVAIEAMDKVTATKLAQRESRSKTVGEQAKEGMDKESKNESKTSGEPGSIDGTDPKK